ncbi:MAG TPA: MG2 domain-containing protein, partial [Kofleriaceae bacterium]
MRTFQRHLFRAALVSIGACASGPGASTSISGVGAPEPTALQSSTDRTIAALAPTRVAPTDATRSIDAAIASHFQRTATRRAYLMTDKPLYQPGETIWLRADLRATGTLIGAAPTGLTISLISPRGATAMQRRVQAVDGVAQIDLALAAELDGGEYTLQLAADDGTTDRKKIIVSTYEAPRLMKTVELLRKAYGEGDPVAAAVELKRATGEAFANRPITAVVTVDDAEVARLPGKTDADGKATVKFQLPGHIARGDGLVTIMADDGGVTESIQKRIPIVMKALQLQVFPEGGDLIDGLPGRVYVQAKSMIGKPADVEGVVVDDRGQTVASFSTIHDGLGRFDVTPLTDRSYHVEITRPAGIAQ